MSDPKTKWTILTYIAAHNNLEDAGIRSWRQICNVGSTKQVMHGVLFDGPRGASRYIFGDPGKELIKEDFHNFDSGDPDRLIETATWLFQKYPAKNYCLILWSHGTGWQPNEIQKIARQARSDTEVSVMEADQRSASTGSPALFRTTLSQILKQPSSQRAVLFDDGSQHSLDTLELFKVIEKVNEKTGVPLELIGMDACLMASLEVAYQIRNSVHFMIASEELVPAASWPYDVIYGNLKANPNLAGGDLAALITKKYAEYYGMKELSTLGGDITKVALNLSKVVEISNALEQLCKNLIAEMETVAPLLWNTQITCRDRELHQRVHSKFDIHLWDIQSLAHELAAQSIGNRLLTACQGVSNSFHKGGAVLNNIHQGSWFEGIGGVSIYLPMPNESPGVTKYYPELNFAKDTSWYEMLLKYHQDAKSAKARMQSHLF